MQIYLFVALWDSEEIPMEATNCNRSKLQMMALTNGLSVMICSTQTHQSVPSLILSVARASVVMISYKGVK